MLSKLKTSLPYFSPDRRQSLILGNFDYSAIRFMVVDKDGNPKEKGFADLPEVQQDMEVFSSNIQQYGFDPDFDIVQKTNLSMDAIKKTLAMYSRRIADNSDSNKKTLTLVYYGGHGMMKDNMSQIVMPDSKKKIPLYNLESRLRSLGELDNSFVIGIFDCCREAYDEGMFPPV